MELLYLWIDDFRYVHEQGFNFSSEIQISLIKNELVKGKKYLFFNLEVNENYVDLFEGNVINVTGVIGGNGSGKSTLFHAIKLLSGRLQDVTSAMCFFTLEKGTVNCYYYHDGRSEQTPLDIKITKSKSIKYSVSAPKPYSIKKEAGKSNEIIIPENIFDNTTCCYFSNTFDSHREDIYHGVVNVSTNYRVEEFLKKYAENLDRSYKRRKKEGPLLFLNHKAEYHKSELRTLLRFVSYVKGRKTGDVPKIPSSLQIEFNFEDYDHLINELKDSKLFDVKDIIKIQEAALKQISEQKDQRQSLYDLILFMAFCYALRWDLFKPNHYSMGDTYGSIKTLANSTENLFDGIERMFSSMEITDDEYKKRKLELLLGSPLKKAISKLHFVKTKNGIESKNRFHLSIEDGLWPFLNLVHEYKYVVETSFINYIWSGLSTGEEAFLTHFARLYEAKSNIQSEFIWLVIDEGELYFHPEWQKDYISKLLSYVQFIFPRKKVQIFISSHSPFIASDLPKSNLIFLKADPTKEKGCIVTNIEDRDLTFGGNLLSLYRNSFFLSELIGSFAKEKIDEIFKWADKKQVKHNDPNYYRKLINQIGEPILMNKLKELYSQTTGDTQEEEERLVSMQNQIAERLRAIKSKKNDSNKKQ